MPIFDASVRGSHPEDFLLLRNGHLHFFRHGWAGDRLLADLGMLGYQVFMVDLSCCADADAVRARGHRGRPGLASRVARVETAVEVA